MSLRLEVAKRDFELERLKAKQKTKQVRDHPLINQDGGAAAAGQAGRGFGGGPGLMKIDTNDAKKDGDDIDSDDGGIEDKIKEVSIERRIHGLLLQGL